MSMKFLDSTGVNTFWEKIKSVFASKEELSQKADISDLSNVLAEDVVDSTTVPTLDTFTREQLKKDLFIDLWKSACGSYGTYNENTGYFELNGLTDITYKQAVNIYENAYWHGTNVIRMSTDNTARTNILGMSVLDFYDEGLRIPHSLYSLLRCPSIEVLRVSNDTWGFVASSISVIFFNSCTSLREVLGFIDLRSITTEIKTLSSLSNSTPNLERFFLKNLKVSINMQYIPKLSLESLNFLVDNAANTSAITVTVHPDVYSKIMDSTNTEWHQLWTNANAKNISFAVGSTATAASLDNDELNYSE